MRLLAAVLIVIVATLGFGLLSYLAYVSWSRTGGR